MVLLVELGLVRTYGVPQEVLTDNGKVFTGRFGPGTGEVLFDRICRENGIKHILTAPRSPTTTGKVERWHKTLRREFLNGRVFDSMPAAIDGAGSHDGVGDPTARVTRTTHRFHDRSLVARTGKLPALWGDPDHPLVYVSFGSVAAGTGWLAAIYRATLDALADMPVGILMTTGRGVDPASLTPIPPNAHVEHWWPQADALSHTSAVIGHGGFGTTMMTLAAGVPQIIVPLFALDQTINAERVAKIGAGLHLVGGPDAVAADPRRPRASPRPSGISPTRWRGCSRHGRSAVG